jgi:predicted negative regulator of RcsB-dependent stress response
VYDSLGEALALKGVKKEALANYQKALEMSPEGQHARIQTAMAALR